jgi:hypothetical protein
MMQSPHISVLALHPWDSITSRIRVSSFIVHVGGLFVSVEKAHVQLAL